MELQHLSPQVPHTWPRLSSSLRSIHSRTKCACTHLHSPSTVKKRTRIITWRSILIQQPNHSIFAIRRQSDLVPATINATRDEWPAVVSLTQRDTGYGSSVNCAYSRRATMICARADLPRVNGEVAELGMKLFAKTPYAVSASSLFGMSSGREN